MPRKTRGSAKMIAFAGAGLLGLVVVVAIMVTMAEQQAKTTVQTKKNVETQIEGIQKTITEQGLRAREAEQQMAPGVPAGEWAVVLEDAGMDETGVVQVIAQVTGLSEAEARTLVAAPPATIKAGLTQTQANAVAKQLIAAGATAKAVQGRP